MALRLNTKLMKVADEFADFENEPRPIFRTRETDSMFILTFQLKGFRPAKVERSDDWTKIKVRVEKVVQGRLSGYHNIETWVVEKSFKVPPGVLTDQVRARFNEDDSELIIRMPKATKGLRGFGIEELKENQTPEPDKPLHIYTSGELSDEQENQETEANQDKENSKREQIETNDNDSKNDESPEPKSAPRRFKICTPLVFGSAFFMSLIVLVFHLVQQSEKPIKQRKKEDED
uniref:uncharacterized protein LOC122580453 n=1 Tax=Erigeron canadensis TaxID=72917 RepID=UPI001CB95FA3|nr:uncharacterized protein LOC122580453 [Erigeron canadensis]